MMIFQVKKKNFILLLHISSHQFSPSPTTLLSSSYYIQNVLRGVGGVRSAASTEAVAGLPLIGAISHQPGVGLGFLRGYVAANGVHQEFASKTNLSDLHFILAHPGIRRFFSTEAPKKKNDENFYPKEKKEIPKGSEEKSESKEEGSNADDRNNFQERETSLLPSLSLLLVLSFHPPDPPKQQQISFQKFKNELLEPGLVDHIVVSNILVATVYVKGSPRNQTSDDLVHGTGASARGHGDQSKFYINIASVESFKKKLENAQEALGIDPHNYVPVTYVSELLWHQELMATLFFTTLMLTGIMRMHVGLGGGGGGGKGGCGIFNIGKGHVTKVDKSSKNKVYFKDVGGYDETNDSPKKVE